MNTAKPMVNRPISLLSILLLVVAVVGCMGGSTGQEPDTGNLFNSGTVGPGGTFSFTFEEEGTVEYFCDIHIPDMQGEVTVASGAEISGQDTVEMTNTQFVPRQITVAPNTEIVWINRDGFAHTVVDGNP